LPFYIRPAFPLCFATRGKVERAPPASRDERTALRFTPRPIRSPGFLKDTLLRSMTVFLRSCLLVLGIALVWSASPVHAQGFLQSPSRPVRVADIRIEGNKTVDEALILNALQLEKGESYAPAVL